MRRISGRPPSEVYGRPIPAPWLRWATYGSIAAAVALVGFGAWSLLSSRTRAHGDGVRRRHAAATALTTSAAATQTQRFWLTAAGRRRRRLRALDQLLVQHGNDTTTEAALGKLFALWHLQYRANGGKGCDQARSQGLECLFQKGSWAQLRTLNRPAVLTLTDDVGRTHQVVLTGLTDESATIQLGGASREVPITALSRYWFGDFLLLWKPPMALGEVARPRHARRRRALASRQHARAQGLPQAPAVNDVYDDDLTRLVQEFQRQHRLNVDGVAGVHTQIVLDTVLNATGSPTLDGYARATGGRLSDVVHPRRTAQIGARAAAPEGTRAGGSPHRARETEDEHLGRLRPSALLVVNLVAVGVLMLRRAQRSENPAESAGMTAASANQQSVD